MCEGRPQDPRQLSTSHDHDKYQIYYERLEALACAQYLRVSQNPCHQDQC